MHRVFASDGYGLRATMRSAGPWRLGQGCRKSWYSQSDPTAVQELDMTLQVLGIESALPEGSMPSPRAEAALHHGSSSGIVPVLSEPGRTYRCCLVLTAYRSFCNLCVCYSTLMRQETPCLPLLLLLCKTKLMRRAAMPTWPGAWGRSAWMPVLRPVKSCPHRRHRGRGALTGVCAQGQPITPRPARSACLHPQPLIRETRLNQQLSGSKVAQRSQRHGQALCPPPSSTHLEAPSAVLLPQRLPPRRRPA